MSRKTNSEELNLRRQPQSHSGQSQAIGVVAHNVALHRFAVALVAATFLLLALGGTVTSQGVGLSVPDWPTTYGYFMFWVPWDMWIGRGGIFWEHAHRLMGSVVGVMTLAMMLWLWVSQKHRPWLKWLGVTTLLLVSVQGVMGGLRVTERSVGLAILHGITAQLVLCATVWIAAATGRIWGHSYSGRTRRFELGLRRLGLVLIAVILVQLVLGASMRHTGARLAIPDFPTAYGRWVPPMNQEAIQAAIDEQPYEQFTQYYTAAQVGVHFAHRMCAVIVIIVAVWWITKLSVLADSRLMLPMIAVAGLLLIQIALGAMVIWTGSSGVNNDMATLHQVTGAAILASAMLLVLRVHVLRRKALDPIGFSEPAIVNLKGAIA